MKRRNFIKGIVGTCAFLASGVAFSEPKENKNKEKIDPFYIFFEKFNGFPINDYQKRAYQSYINKKSNYFNSARQTGMTTFLVTMTAWQSFQNKQVIHLSENVVAHKHTKRIYDINIIKIGLTPPKTPNFTILTKLNVVGYSRDTHFHFDLIDRSFMDIDYEYRDILQHYKNKLFIGTFNIKYEYPATFDPIIIEKTTKL